MMQVDILDAETNLFALVHAIESGEQDIVVITRDGEPVAQLVPYASDTSKRFGAAKGKFLIPDDWEINEGDDEIAAMFGVA